jgi:putative redox protein
VGKITVGVRWSRDAQGHEHIERRLSFARPLSEEQKAQLLQVAEESPISRVLRPGVSIQSAVVD